MRKKVQGNGLVLQAVAGTYVVTLGWDITQESVKTGLLGFAIQRVDRLHERIFIFSIPWLCVAWSSVPRLGGC